MRDRVCVPYKTSERVRCAHQAHMQTKHTHGRTHANICSSLYRIICGCGGGGGGGGCATHNPGATLILRFGTLMDMEWINMADFVLAFTLTQAHTYFMYNWHWILCGAERVVGVSCRCRHFCRDRR